MTDRFARAAELAFSDLLQAADFVPAEGAVQPPRRILLTGATGFLGVTVLAGLLERPGTEVVCLVRAASVEQARSRLAAAFAAATGSALPAVRVRIALGDLALPALGLGRRDFEWLSAEVDLAIHCGAEVNWSKPYHALRAVNVLSVLELARLCCARRRKPLLFVSTLAVCYAHGAPDRVDEDADMSPYLAGMPLAYAQAKCVGERLLARLAERGLPVTIVRSGLIAADSRTGRSNPDDLLCRLLLSAARTGIAPDVDWQVDACPVDFVAAVLVALACSPRPGFSTLHVHHRTPRHWREIVAWLNIAGYRAALVPYADWLDHVRHATPRTDPDLRPLRAFFLARPGVLGGNTLPELYFEANRQRIESGRSLAMLDALGLRAPELDGPFLARCTGTLCASGHLPPTRQPQRNRKRAVPLAEATLATLLRAHFREPRLEIVELERHNVDGGILSELFSWQLGRDAGVAKYAVTYRRRRHAPVEALRIVLKRKPGDDLLLAAGEAVASACGTTLGRAFRTHGHGLGFLHAQEREVALYQLAEPRLQQHMPCSYGWTRDHGELGSLALECLDDAAFPRWAGPDQPWPDAAIRAVVQAAARIHSPFLGSTGALERESWHMREPDAAEMLPLWHALADHAAEFFSSWWGESSIRLQRSVADTARKWRSVLASMPRALIHNDFNPRNLAFRPGAGRLRPCAFDWELATIRVPQYDLAELLCFVLPADAAQERVMGYLELHRATLQRLSAVALGREAWLAGFGLSLNQLLLERLPLYTLFHRLRPQPFLQRVLQNWRRLHQCVAQQR